MDDLDETLAMLDLKMCTCVKTLQPKKHTIRYISCATYGIQVSCCKATVHGNFHMTSQCRECAQLSALITHVRSYSTLDTGYVRHTRYEHWICFATDFCMHRLELQTWNNGKLMAALEGVLARLDLLEDTQDQLEQMTMPNQLLL